eukprot:10895971-Heterocapsa_arctica.AAC.1
MRPVGNAVSLEVRCARPPGRTAGGATAGSTLRGPCACAAPAGGAGTPHCRGSGGVALPVGASAGGPSSELVRERVGIFSSALAFTLARSGTLRGV